jgi:hypothetical protein
MSVNFGFGPRFPITCIMLFNYLNINQLWGHNRNFQKKKINCPINNTSKPITK